MAVDMIVRDPDADALPVLGIAGLAVAAAAAVWLWGESPIGDGFASTLRGGRYALFFTVLLCAGSALAVLLPVDCPRAAPATPAGALRARAPRHDRHDLPRCRQRPDRALPGAGDHVGCRLRADRDAPRRATLHRGGAQVLPARRLRDRLPPLRDRLLLRGS